MPWQSPGEQLLKGDLVEHPTQTGPNRNPDCRQMLGHPVIPNGLWPMTAHLRERSVDDPEHGPEGDLGRRASEVITTVGAAGPDQVPVGSTATSFVADRRTFRR